MWNSENLLIFQFIKSRKLSIWKIKEFPIFYHFKNYQIFCVWIISKQWKINSEINISNNSSFDLLILAILKFWNFGRSTLYRSKILTLTRFTWIFKGSWKSRVCDFSDFLFFIYIPWSSCRKNIICYQVPKFKIFWADSQSWCAHI